MNLEALAQNLMEARKAKPIQVHIFLWCKNILVLEQRWNFAYFCMYWLAAPGCKAIGRAHQTAQQAARPVLRCQAAGYMKSRDFTRELDFRPAGPNGRPAGHWQANHHSRHTAKISRPTVRPASRAAVRALQLRASSAHHRRRNQSGRMMYFFLATKIHFLATSDFLPSFSQWRWQNQKKSS